MYEAIPLEGGKLNLRYERGENKPRLSALIVVEQQRPTKERGFLRTVSLNEYDLNAVLGQFVTRKSVAISFFHMKTVLKSIPERPPCLGRERPAMRRIIYGMANG